MNNMEGHRIPTYTRKLWTFNEAGVRYILYSMQCTQYIINRDDEGCERRRIY